MQTERTYAIDIQEVFTRFLKYAFEGIVVAIAAFTIPSNKLDMNETVTIALVAMCTFSVLDYFAPSMAGAARLGAGAGIGASLVGFPGGAGRHRKRFA
jgi:ribose/xylose/arabinose/galactoside ABC-type transport system permease subunit